MNDMTDDGDEAFVKLKNGPMDGVVIRRREKDSIADGLYIGPGPYYPRYRVMPGSVSPHCRIRGMLTMTVAHRAKFPRRTQVPPKTSRASGAWAFSGSTWIPGGAKWL